MTAISVLSAGRAAMARFSQRALPVGGGELERGRQVARQLAEELDAASVDRMREAEPLGVQELPAQPDLPARHAVHRIAEDRMPDGGEVHADLVRAPGLELEAQQARALERLRELEMRHGGTLGTPADG